MKTSTFLPAACALIATALASFGCASRPRVGESQPETLSSPDPALGIEARTLTIFRGSDGAAVGWDAMIEGASSADVVVIGENHGHPLGLAFAQELWSDVLGRRERAVLSMEFFNRDEQSRLDDYLSGLWDEAAFTRATRRTSDAAYPPGHRSMVLLAKARSRPVVASNAPRVYVRAASRESYERLASLSEEQRRMFRIPDSLPAGRYRADYDALMSDPMMASHGGPAREESPEELRKRLDSSFRAQSLWDWTMAESVARAIDREGSPVVHVVGRFHSDFRGGLVEAILNLRPGTSVVTLSVVDSSSGALADADRGRADYVVYVGAAE